MATNPNQDTSPDIFAGLFGGSSRSSPLPLFADNSFRRKPQSVSSVVHLNPLGSDENPNFEPSEGPKDPQETGSNQKELKTRKRDRENIRSSISESVEIDTKASKRRKRSDEEIEIRKKKKKRKRDEIEEEYESKKYGLREMVEEKKIESGRANVGEKRKTVDDAAETMVVSDEAYDDESKLLRTVFVGNLPVKVKKKLLKEFKCFGEIDSVRIRSVPIMDSKVPRKGAIIQGNINDAIDSVHAYIVFKEEKSAEASLSHNMAEVGGKHIRVDRACPPRKKLKGLNAPLYDNKRTVFVGNLPFDVKDEELYQLFNGINQLESGIEAVRVIRDPHSSVGKGIAYVLFKTREACNFIARKKNMKLRDRVLRLSHSKSDSTPSKRNNPSTTHEGYSPRKRIAVASSQDKPRVTAASLSYQGLRASKSGAYKKSLTYTKTGGRGKTPSDGAQGTERKVRISKRPAVAARKANAAMGGSSTHTGKKRKPGQGTPGSAHRNKKAKRFK